MKTICLVISVVLLSGAGASAQVVRLRPPTELNGGNFGSRFTAFRIEEPLQRTYVAVGMYQGYAAGAIEPEGRVIVYDAVAGEHIGILESPMRQPGGAFGFRVASTTNTLPGVQAQIVVSAYFESPPGRTSVGRAYIMDPFTSDTFSTLAPSIDQNQANFSIGGVEYLSDIDGDGADDIVVGSWNQLPYGWVYVFSGATGERLHLISSPTNAMGFFGRSVVGLPDVDGDGAGDFVTCDINEPWDDTRENFGVIYPYSGATAQPRARLLFQGVNKLAPVPDVNGDGVADYMAATSNGAPYPSSGGVVRVFSGADASLIHSFYNPEPTHLRWTV